MLVDVPTNCTEQFSCENCPELLCEYCHYSNFDNGELAVIYVGRHKQGGLVVLFDAFEEDRFFYVGKKGLKEINLKTYKRLIKLFTPQKAKTEIQRVEENHAYSIQQNLEKAV